MFGESRDDKVRELTGRISALEQEMKFLRQRCDRYNRMLQAVWDLLKEKQVFTEEDMDSAMRKAAKAAIASGAGRPARKCPKCSRPLQENLPACMYCGQIDDGCTAPGSS